MTAQQFQHRSWSTWMHICRAAGGYIMAGVIALGPIGIASLARAADNPATAPAAEQPVTGVTHAERKSFEQYLRKHPRVARQLRKDPSLANDPQFLSKHTSLQKFLAAHPAVSAQLKENPGAMVRGEKHAKPAPAHKS